MPQLQIYWDTLYQWHASYCIAAYEKADCMLNICSLFSASENNFQSKETFKNGVGICILLEDFIIK